MGFILVVIKIEILSDIYILKLSIGKFDFVSVSNENVLIIYFENCTCCGP